MVVLALNLANITINSLGPSFSRYILVQDLIVLWLLGWEFVWSFVTKGPLQIVKTFPRTTLPKNEN